MASSSSSPPKPHNIYKTKVLNVQQVDEKAKAEERDLLELRLGRGFALPCQNLNTSASTSSCSFFPLPQPKQLDLGLGLGCYTSISSAHHQSFISPDLNPRPSHPPADHAIVPCTIPTSMPPFRLRPQPGLWFTLRSSPSRKKEMSLPQIPKMYIRVKDDTVTVLTVKTYLVTKLGLSNDAEIEILCKGQSLMSSETLKHARDTIWLPRLVESVIESAGDSTAISISNGVQLNHLMCLDYKRKC